MKYTLFAIAFGSLCLAFPAPTSENPAWSLMKRNFGNCNGCSKCNLSNTFIGNCHDAVNKFQSGFNYNSRILRELFTYSDIHLTLYRSEVYCWRMLCRLVLQWRVPSEGRGRHQKCIQRRSLPEGGLQSMWRVSVELLSRERTLVNVCV